MQRLVLVLGGMLALFVVGQLATQATPPPTIAANSPPSHKTGLPPAASHSAPIESDAAARQAVSTIARIPGQRRFGVRVHANPMGAGRPGLERQIAWNKPPI